MKRQLGAKPKRRFVVQEYNTTFMHVDRLWHRGTGLHSKTAYDRWGMSGANLIEHLAPRKVEIVVCPPKNVYRYVLRSNNQA